MKTVSTQYSATCVKRHRLFQILIVALSFIGSLAASAATVSPAFTIQGNLFEGGAPASGVYVIMRAGTYGIDNGTTISKKINLRAESGSVINKQSGCVPNGIFETKT